MSPSTDHALPLDVGRLRCQAKRRRDALTAAGCSTYALGLKGGTPAIICLCCGLGSPNPSDVENRYCGFCHEYHAEERP